ARHVKRFRGSLTRVNIPPPAALEKYTENVRGQSLIPEALRIFQPARPDAPSRPVPERLGEPSVFEHVVYIIKENRTYDQVFGDLAQGNGDPSLTIFGREVTPNHHALAERYVLLDNYYCNGVLSADGHSWATEGFVTDHLEKAFGGFSRSYTFGDDPLTYSSSGFIWDPILARGKTFRNFG
ncbi:MAG: phosphoesterase, partial [Candidatus Competibacteraceae bacterium]|nr:phosphoesterase [Candidatus Competibacteraceae bacterium]